MDHPVRKKSRRATQTNIAVRERIGNSCLWAESFYEGRATLHWPSIRVAVQLDIGAIDARTQERLNNLHTVGSAMSNGIGAEVMDTRLTAGRRLIFFVTARASAPASAPITHSFTLSKPITIGSGDLQRTAVNQRAVLLEDAAALQWILRTGRGKTHGMWPSSLQSGITRVGFARGMGLIRIPRLTTKAAAKSMSLYTAQNEVVNTGNVMKLITRFATLYCTPTTAESRAFSRACAQGDVTALDGMLHAGIDPSHGDQMIKAIQSGATAVVARLIQAGADVNSIGSYWNWVNRLSSFGYTPLMMAAKECDTESCKLLIEAGAHLDKTIEDPRASGSPKYITALIIAVKSGIRAQGVVMALIEAGADVNKEWDPACCGHTPIYWASRWKGNVHVVQALIDGGADVDTGNSVTALGNAALNNNICIVQRLIRKGADVDKAIHVARTTTTALHIAARMGFSEVVQALIEGGGDVNTKNCGDDTDTPIRVASMHGHFRIVALLLKGGADRADMHPATYGVYGRHRQAILALLSMDPQAVLDWINLSPKEMVAWSRAHK